MRIGPIRSCQRVAAYQRGGTTAAFVPLLSYNFKQPLEVGQDEDRADPFLPVVARMALPRLIVPLYLSRCPD